MKITTSMIVALLFSLPLLAQSPKHELRAVWLATIGGIDWPRSHRATAQREELCRTLDQLRAAGINTVLLQTRIRATTIFPSDLEPWDGCLTGRPGQAPGYDPLQLAIDECHKRGMELHAWVVTIPVGKWNALGCKTLRQKHPKLLRRIGEDGYLNPEHEQTANYLSDVCREIVSRYDVDGIHLDYIRYPEQWPRARKGGESDRRRAYITRIVNTISQSVKQLKPWVKMSCSPVGKYTDLLRYSSGGWNARNAVSQDAQLWIREGLMDQLYPMIYFRDNQFFPFAIDWQENACGHPVASGLAIWFLDPREGRWRLSDVSRQLHVSRQLGLGHCFFRSKFLTDDHQGIYRFVSRFNATPALVPPMMWSGQQPPLPPQTLSRVGQQLSWTGVVPVGDSPNVYYNVYASRTYPVDTDNPANLVAVRLSQTSLTVPADNALFYAVTAYDRYGQESHPRQQTTVPAHQTVVPAPLPMVQGRQLLLPEKPSTLDADRLVIETLQGKPVVTVPYLGKYADISQLPPGTYVMRSIGRKGRNHRLGFFSKK